MPQPRDARGRFMRKDLLAKEPFMLKIMPWVFVATLAGLGAYYLGLYGL